MTKLKRSITCTLAFAMALAAAAGCSNGNEPDNNAETASAPKNESASKLKLLGPTKANKFVKFDDREQYPVWQEVDKMFDGAGLDLEYELVPNEQYDVVIKTRMASGSSLPDIVNLSALDDTTVLNLAKQGVILDLNPLIEKYSNGNIKKLYNEQFPFAKKTTTSPDGKLFWLSDLHKKTYEGDKPAPVALTMLIRKDWLEKLNLSVPATAEAYRNALLAMREGDANGNGEKDEVLVYNPGNFAGAIAQWFGLGTGVTAVDVENKKIVSPWYQDGIKDYFRYMQQLVKDGLIDTSLISARQELVQQKIADNKVISLSDYNLEMWLEPTIRGGGEYLPLMPLKAVDGIKPAAQLEDPYLVWQKYAITKDAKDVEAAIKFFDIVYSEKYADLLYWGIEGQTYTYENGAKVFIDNGTEEDKAKSKLAPGGLIYGGGIFPRIQFANLESELTNVPKHKADQQLAIMEYKPYYVNMNHKYLAIPDDKQLETKTKIMNNLSTYSMELATKLALGQKSLDDWDQYMKELKELGLDQLIEIEQQLHDRYNEIE
ncbi:ABC transporter substrate-binding protein [Paenibacillus pasadenensis]|uniref:extracellular solute-binding protein n=1 Tax=Paenibacillus pasadenensis TaxID=217090 RepID=UPI0020408BF4|nr:extracellular solute-binding protein [Paenibacillus pasadenensis]MCM3747001.1 ABC transporter substrate-binding protein [Paenibacillus pasadenensis]